MHVYYEYMANERSKKRRKRRVESSGSELHPSGGVNKARDASVSHRGVVGLCPVR